MKKLCLVLVLLVFVFSPVGCNVSANKFFRDLDTLLSKIGFTGLIIKDGAIKYALKPDPTKEYTLKETDFVVKAKEPYLKTKPVFLASDPEKIVQEESWRMESKIPKLKWARLPKLKLGSDPVRLINENTVKKLQDYIKPGQVIHIIDAWTPMFVSGRSGHVKEVLVPPKTLLICDEVYEKDTQIRIPILIPYCWNAVSGVRFVKISRVVSQKNNYLSTERYLDEKTIIKEVRRDKRFRDIQVLFDYTPALWIGFAALVVGILLGRSTASNFGTSKKYPEK